MKIGSDENVALFGSADDAGRRLVDLGLIGFWECDFRTGRVKVSPDVARFYGMICFDEPPECDVAQLAGKIPVEDQIWTERWRPLSIDSTGMGTIQYRVQDEQGNARWIMCRGRYTTEANGAILTGHGIIFDVSAAKREGKNILSPEELAGHPADRLADLLIEAHGIARTLADDSLSASLSAALGRLGVLLAQSLSAGADRSLMH